MRRSIKEKRLEESDAFHFVVCSNVQRYFKHFSQCAAIEPIREPRSTFSFGTTSITEKRMRSKQAKVISQKSEYCTPSLRQHSEYEPSEEIKSEDKRGKKTISRVLCDGNGNAMCVCVAFELNCEINTMQKKDDFVPYTSSKQ